MDSRPNASAPTTGLPGLDAVLRGVQPGDNIVWQVEALADYELLVRRYAAAARAQGRRLVYFRFGAHPPLLGAEGGAQTHAFDPAEGFDGFVDRIHSVIEAAGRDTWYVLDCLSDLAEAWQSDLMVGNFFRLTCPRLFDLDTVTYFALLRHRHAPSAVEMIRDTTQYLLDVFRCRERLYVRPIKVQHRSAAAMNLIHAWEDADRFRAVTDSGTVAEVLAGSDWRGLEDRDFPGHWRRHFDAARAVAAQARGGRADPAMEAFWFERLAGLLFPQHPAMTPLVRRYLTLEDLFAIRDRMIGNGAIGGKALGMLLARAILRREAPALHQRLEAHDSFYVGTEVFDTFFVTNGLWWIRRRQRDPAGFLRGLDEARARIAEGAFTAATLRQFGDMLDYFGEWPYIVRSSSRLEDLHGSAFAGQYDSVFCANRGSREQRLEELLRAVRTVYAGVLSEKALRYRERRGLLDAHEQMALLIMRVSGTAGGRWFHPHAAGVGLSVNPYRWHPRIDVEAGVLRLVAGLGTRAVDRHDEDYTRVIALDAPALRPETSFGAIARHAQRRMDAVDLEQGRVVTGAFTDMVRGQPGFPLALFTSRETPDGPPFLTFDGLLERTDFVPALRGVLATLHAAYRHPLEIEFALNLPADGEGWRLNLLQCRPMQVRGGDGLTAAEPPGGARALLQAQGALIGPSRVIQPDRLVWIDPARYGASTLEQRGAIARLVGRINQLSAGRTLALFGPGRWGSSDPWLGVPVVFAEINHVAALCEVVAMREGLVPEVSLGTHFLHELIEADMLYFALFPGREGNDVDQEALRALPNALPALLPEAARWADSVRVVELPAGSSTLYADCARQRVVLTAPVPG